LFHIDFEYILGNDPKPFAPPMKLCEQMVVAMGGRASKVNALQQTVVDCHVLVQEYIKFQRLACRAFLILRQHSAIVVNMFDLVSQDIFDSTGTNSAAPRLLERFQLNLSDDDAVLHMQQVGDSRCACARGPLRRLPKLTSLVGR
jgi:phosphatidylinositol 3-kinase